MGILKYLPTFNQIEPDNLLGLTMGYVLAQRPLKYTASTDTYGVPTVKDKGFVENGILCGLDADGNVVSATSDTDQVFIHFTEELNTVIKGRKFFAVETAGSETFLRLVALVPGSEWTTNVADADSAYAALISAGRIKVTNASATLPNGDSAKSYVFIK